MIAGTAAALPVRSAGGITTIYWVKYASDLATDKKPQQSQISNLHKGKVSEVAR
jgi:hypothetical protein